MLPEVWFSSPLDGGGSGSGSFAVDTDDSATEEQMNKFLGLVPRHSPDSPEGKREALKRKLDAEACSVEAKCAKGRVTNPLRQR